MILGKTNNGYGETYYGEGNTIEEVLADLKDVTGDNVAAEDIIFFECKELKVKTKYVIE